MEHSAWRAVLQRILQRHASDARVGRRERGYLGGPGLDHQQISDSPNPTSEPPGFLDSAPPPAPCDNAGRQPRERLMRFGAATLSDSELIALLLGTGTRGESVHDMSARLLAEAGGLSGLRMADPLTVARKGVGPAKASRVLAAVELATRLAFRELPKRLPLDRPESSARYLLLRYGVRDQEVMGALFLNVRNHVIYETEIFRGTLRRAAVEPRAILRVALSVGAAGVLMFHTHPSGDPTPSAEDLAFTERLDRALDAIGLQLVDHLILGDVERWTSLRRCGALASARRKKAPSERSLARPSRPQIGR